jgi:hypothetical protein
MDFEDSGYAGVRGPRRIGVGILIEEFAGKTYQSGCDEYRVGQKSELELRRQDNRMGYGDRTVVA